MVSTRIWYHVRPSRTRPPYPSNLEVFQASRSGQTSVSWAGGHQISQPVETILELHPSSTRQLMYVFDAPCVCTSSFQVAFLLAEGLKHISPALCHLLIEAFRKYEIGCFCQPTGVRSVVRACLSYTFGTLPIAPPLCLIHLRTAFDI